jgi:hypothetical protein
MEVFPTPPLSRGRSGGGWDIYVAVVLDTERGMMHRGQFVGIGK